MPDLDDRIRDLVARAAADAPPPPRLDGSATLDRDDERSGSRARWIVGGLAGLSAAAALVALFWVGGDRVAEEPTIPIAPVTTVTPVTPVAPVTPETTTRSTAEPALVPSTAPASTPTVPPPTATTPTSDPAAGDDARRYVVAGPDGVTAVRLDEAGGEFGDLVTDEPMARALALADGRTLMQRTYNDSDPAADSALLVIEPGTTTPVALDVPAEFNGVGLRLHDAATVGEETIVIVETRPGVCVNPTECVGALWAFGPDSGRLDRLQEKIVWEGGWSRLSLATTGVVVGTETELTENSLRSWIIPGSGAEPVDFAAEGLEPTYGDCTDCPRGFTIDRNGDFLAWVETDLTTFQTTLVFANLGENDVERVPLTDADTVCCLDGTGPDLPVVPAVEFDLSVVGDQSLIRAVVNDEGVLNGDPPRPALVVDIATGEVTAAEGFHAFG